MTKLHEVYSLANEFRSYTDKQGYWFQKVQGWKWEKIDPRAVMTYTMIPKKSKNSYH